jgi:hypothetical protein
MGHGTAPCGPGGRAVTGAASPRRTRSTGGPAAALAAALALAPCGPPAAAAVVFREVETLERPGAPVARQVRQVAAEGESCRILQEESADPSAPAGTYLLVTPDDAFVVDPARETLAPLAPTRLEPADRAAEAEGALVTGVTLDTLYEADGPKLLGLPTRHAVHRLRYELRLPGAAAPEQHEERHETWATRLPWLDGVPPGWRAWRVAEDAGAAAERRELREALDALHEHGLVLRHLVERRTVADDALTERVSREVTSVAEELLPPETFQRPAGYALSEFLAPPAGAPEAQEPAPADGAGGGGS